MTSSTVCFGMSRRRSVVGLAGRPSTMAALAVVLLAVTARLHPVEAFSTHRQQQIEHLLGGAASSDGSEIEEIKHIEKRESKGTCTCTCETRPVSSSSGGAEHQPGATSGVVQQSTATQALNRIPETAALIRTAASMKDAAAARPRQQAQSQNSAAKTQSKAATTPQRTESKMASNGYEHSAPVSTADDYETMVKELNNGGRSGDRYDDSHEEKDEENEQSSNQDNWSVDGSERWPWERLPDTICLRQHCTSDRNCCRRYNICDKSAHVCTDCWHGSACTSERDCCMAYKFCKREWKISPETGQSVIVGGKCVSSL